MNRLIKSALIAGGIVLGTAVPAFAHTAAVAGSCAVRSYTLSASDDNLNPVVKTITGPVTGLTVGQSVKNVDPVFTATGPFSVVIRWTTDNFEATVQDANFTGGTCAGVNGKDGKDGTNGTNGTNGKDGAKGEKGDTGIQGPAGSPGEHGSAGLNGVDGVDGSNGKDGSNGQNGASGNDGATGAAGSIGPVGGAGAAGTPADQSETDNLRSVVTELNNRLFLLEHATHTDLPATTTTTRQQTPAGTLPHTGSNSTMFLALGGIILLGTGLGLRRALR